MDQIGLKAVGHHIYEEKTPEERGFAHYYRSNLLPSIVTLDVQRKKVVAQVIQNLIQSGLVFLAFVVLFFAEPKILADYYDKLNWAYHDWHEKFPKYIGYITPDYIFYWSFETILFFFLLFSFIYVLASFWPLWKFSKIENMPQITHRALSFVKPLNYEILDNPYFNAPMNSFLMPRMEFITYKAFIKADMERAQLEVALYDADIERKSGFTRVLQSFTMFHGFMFTFQFEKYYFNEEDSVISLGRNRSNINLLRSSRFSGLKNVSPITSDFSVFSDKEDSLALKLVKDENFANNLKELWKNLDNMPKTGLGTLANFNLMDHVLFEIDKDRINIAVPMSTQLLNFKDLFYKDIDFSAHLRYMLISFRKIFSLIDIVVAIHENK